MARTPFQVLVCPYCKVGDNEYEYALLKRSDAGWWQAIAGGGQDNETPLDTAKREAQEETGIPTDSSFIQLDTVVPVRVTEFRDSHLWGEEVYVIFQYCFGVLVKDRQMLLSREHTEYRWLKFRAAHDLIKYDGNRTALWELNQRLKGRGPRGESVDESYTQLQMVWPEHRLKTHPAVQLPPGYILRTYRRGDEPRFYNLMELAGWPGWHDEKLQPWLARIPPESWFMIVHTQSNEIVATAMGLHDHSDLHPFGGELGWVAAHPAHAGKGLGMVVCAAVTARLINAGYRNIHLYTEHWRLAAIKTYLKLGYIPFLFTPEMPERWRAICAQLQWPFTPEVWRSDGNADQHRVRSI